jgi:hypothetical protein
VCGTEFENRNSMANHVRWKHKEKKFSDEGYANIKRTAFKAVNEEKQKERGCPVTVFRPCPKCSKVFSTQAFSKRLKRITKFCSQSCANSKDWSSHPNRDKIRESRRNSVLARPSGPFGEKSQDYRGRFSSRVERELAERLGDGFRRHLIVKTESLTFDVDIASQDGRVWIESDGPYHFGKVHRSHNFEKSMMRDAAEMKEAASRDVLLIRVNNSKYSLDEQVDFIRKSIDEWNGSSDVRLLY